MNEFIKWVRKNKFKFALHASVVWLLFAAMAWDGRLLIPCEILIVAGLVSFYFTYTRTIVSLMLALILMLPAKSEEKQEGAGVVCGIAVLVVGGVVCYHIVKTCKKAYARTNSPSELTFTMNTAGTGDDYAASDLDFCGYCYEQEDLSASQSYGETVVYGVTHGEETSLKAVSQPATRAQFVQYLGSHGILMQPGKQYAKNGVPADRFNVPISFPQSRGLVPHAIVGYSGINTVVERSYGVNGPWEVILTNTAPAGIGFQFTDNTVSETAFYRARVLR